MASTYTVNLGIEKIGTGEQSGTWGTTTNTNFDLIDQAINGAVTVTLASAGTSGVPNTLAITDGASSDGRNKFIEFADGADLGATAYVQLTPNDAEKIVHMRNSLSGGRSVIIFQGTYNASNDFEIPNGKDVVLKFDGGGATATVTQVFEDLLVTAVAATTVDTTNIEVTNLKAKDGTSAGSIADSTGVVTLASSVLTTTDINGGSVDGVTLGTNSAVTEAQIDNININGNTISSTDTNGNVTITPDGTGSVAITKIDVAGGEIDGTAIGANSASTAVFTDLTASGTVSFSGATVSDGGTVTTVNIDGGSIDGTIIGAATPAAGSFTTGQFGTSLNVDGTVTADKLDITVGGASFEELIALTNSSTSFAAGVKISASFDSDTQEYGNLTWSPRNANNGYFTINNLLDGSLVKALEIDGNDISFYDPTGTNARIVYNADSAFVINQDSADFDFRVESDSNTHALFVDAGNSRVGINQSAPQTTLHINNDTVTTSEMTLQGEYQASGFTNSNTFNFRHGGSNRMRLQTTQYNGASDAFSWAVEGTNSTLTGWQSLIRAVNTAGGFGAAVVINEDSSAEVDFRVESDTNTHALFVDAGNNRVGMSTSSPATTLDVNGTVTANGLVVDAGATFNEDGGDNDFRVESDANTHMLFVDAGAEVVNIGSSTNYVLGKLFVGGNIRANYNNEISMQYNVSGGTALYHKGMTGTSPETTSARGLHIFNYDNDSSEGIKFYSGAPSGTAYQKVNFKAGQTGEIVFNDNSYDQDFRVESDSNTHALFVDAAGNGAVGINNSSPTAYLHVAGMAASSSTAGAVFEGAWPWLKFKDTESAQDTWTIYNDNAIFINKLAYADRDNAPNTGVNYFFMNTSNVVWNDGSNDQDFRVESDSNTHALFVDAGNDAVCVNTNTPATWADLTVNEQVEADNTQRLYTASKTITTGTTSDIFTITLPAAQTFVIVYYEIENNFGSPQGFGSITSGRIAIERTLYATDAQATVTQDGISATSGAGKITSFQVSSTTAPSGNTVTFSLTTTAFISPTALTTPVNIYLYSRRKDLTVAAA